MTDAPLFRSLRKAATVVALATCVATAPVISTKAFCPACGRKVMEIAGKVAVDVQVRRREDQPTRGIIVRCRPGTCGNYVEVMARG